MTYDELLAHTREQIKEIMPWDLADMREQNPELMILDVREPAEYEFAHIPNSIHVPRGVLESACIWNHDETVPDLVNSREKEVIVVCRSGHRSAFAALVMQQLGYEHPISLNTGLRGWNDYDQPLVNAQGASVDPDDADAFFTTRLREEQKAPA
ncbi:MAG: rhodanese-like domain-containing protein [Thiotrichales bacterium]